MKSILTRWGKNTGEKFRDTNAPYDPPDDPSFTFPKGDYCQFSVQFGMMLIKALDGAHYEFQGDQNVHDPANVLIIHIWGKIW